MYALNAVTIPPITSHTHTGYTNIYLTVYKLTTCLYWFLFLSESDLWEGSNFESFPREIRTVSILCFSIPVLTVLCYRFDHGSFQTFGLLIYRLFGSNGMDRGVMLCVSSLTMY